MRLSVVIPVYNQDDLAVRHVRACASATRPPEEVIVVDDGGAVGLEKKLARGHWPFRLVYARVLEDIPWNQPGARNIGMVLSTGDVISFEDADHLPGSGYYAAALDVLGGRQDVTLVRAEREYGGKTLAPSKSAWCVRRHAILGIGGYDEDFSGHYGHDDGLVIERLLRSGHAKKIGRHISVPAHGGSRGYERDASHNAALLKLKLGKTRNLGGILRAPFCVSIIRSFSAGTSFAFAASRRSNMLD